MVDLREKVVDDRGLISKIQRFVPGFHGYRVAEDLRAADNLLRIQIADRLAAVRADVGSLPCCDGGGRGTGRP